MKSRRFTIFIAFIFIVFATIGYMNFNIHNSKKSNELNFTKLKSMEKDKDADREDSRGIVEMVKWQFERLKDPKTNRIPQNIRQKELAFAKTLPTSNNKLLRKGAQVFSASNWISRGPSNQGGRTKGVAVDISNENIVLAGAADGGVWRSTDNGKTWKITTDPAEVQNVDCLVQDQRTGKTNVWYYGTGELMDNIFPGGNGLYGGLLGNGIYKSTDDGQTWNPLASTQSNSPNQFNNPFQIVWNIGVDTSNYNQDIVYAACIPGIYRSSDGGNTWKVVLKNTQNGSLGFFTDVTVDNAGGVYAGINYTDSAGIYYSADGVNFNNITPSFYPNNTRRLVLTTPPSDKNILYVFANTPGAGQAGSLNDSTSDYGDYNSLWRYNASSKQWTNLSSKLPSWSGSVGGLSTQSGYDMFIRVKPDDENFVVIGGTNIYRTTNGFATQIDSTDWIGGYSTLNDISTYPGNHPDQHTGFFIPSDPKIFISGNDGGLSYTQNILADTVVWNTMNEGYITSQFWSVSIDESVTQDNLMIGGMQDNGTMYDMTGNEKADWINVNGGDGTTSAVADSGKYVYFSSQNGNIYRATQSGEFTRVTPKGANGLMFVTPYILDPNNTNVMYLLDGNHLWRNSDLTQIPSYQYDPTAINWTEFSDSANSNVQLTALAMSKSSSDILYIGTDDGSVYKINSAKDPNSKFQDITSSSFPNAYISSIAVDPKNASNVLVGFSNYNVLSLFYSSDGGASWDTVAGNLEQNPDGSGNGPSVRNVKILPVGGTSVYLAGTSTGLYMTSTLNGMNTKWIQQSPDKIGNVIVETMAVRSGDGLVVAGTFGKGVYSSQVTATAVNEKSDIPNKFELTQNYPNPFNPSTTINYVIPKSGLVSLKIYDSIGRLVKTLVSGYQNEGKHTIVFNADNSRIASGVYFYRLSTNNFVSTKKMILLK